MKKIDTKHLKEQLNLYIGSLKKDELFLTLIKIVMVLFVGGLTGFIIKELSAEHTTTLQWYHFAIWLILLVVAIIIESSKFLRDKNFPMTLISHLTAMEDLKALQSKVDRSGKVNEFLVDVIVRLNGQTCNLQPEKQETMCNQGIVTGVRNLLEPVLANMHFVLGSETTVPMSIALYLKSCITLTDDFNLMSKEEVLRLDDDKLHLFYDFVNHFDTQSKLIGIPLRIKNTIIQAFNDNRYQQESYSGFTVIACPVIDSCDNDFVQGALCVVVKDMIISSDVEGYLKIFNTILSNWLARYGDCILKRYNSHHPNNEL